MALPFTRAEFIEVFARYNGDVWPVQVLAIALAGAIVALAVAGPRTRAADHTVAVALASFWALSGVAYHLRHFSAINPIAHLFGWMFVAEAAALLWAGFAREALAFARPRGLRGILGAVLVLYAVVGYPIVGAAAGHVYPAVPVLGIAPCPTALLTVGLLLLTATPAPRIVLAVPFAWSIVGLSAAVKLGMVEDLGLAVSAAGCAFASARPVRARWSGRELRSRECARSSP